MTLTRDKRFEFLGLHGSPSACRLRVYEGPGIAPIVIVSELHDNPGTSITNWSEQLATDVWRMLDRPPHGPVWIEHYGDWPGKAGQYNLKESFSLVYFAPLLDANGHQTGLRNPHWNALSKKAVESMLSHPLSPEAVPA